MRFLRYIILALILWNLPSVALTSMGETLGSLLSYTSIMLLAIYYFLEEKTAPNWWIIILTLLYFSISSFQYYGETKILINEVVKLLVFIVAGYEIVKRVSIKELYFFILLGSLSILFEIIIYPIKQGRYSGFYLNPNTAGFICIYGYALTYGLKRLPLKLIGQFTFTLMGILTFSRTFIVIWLLLNIISLKISIKNIRIFGLGILIFGSLLIMDTLIGLNNPRFNQLKSIVNNEDVSGQELNEDSRTETWALHYDKIIQSPIIGNGYRTFAGETGRMVGVHNTYLRIIGEAGIIPLLLFLLYFLYLFYWSFILFKTKPFLLMQTIALSLFLLSNHNFFDFYYLTFATMWIQHKIIKNRQNLKESNHKDLICEF